MSVTDPADTAAEPLDALLRRLRGLDVELWLEDGRLRYSAPPGVMGEDLLASLRERREELTAHLRERDSRVRPPITRRADRQDVPLSFGQQRLWLLDRMLPPEGRAAYVLCGLMWVDGPLDARALDQALGAVADRHEALRTVIEERDGAPVGRLCQEPIALREIDLSATPAKAEERARELARAEARAPFDLRTGPLVRAVCARLAPERHAVILAVHHICVDGWSLPLFFADLLRLYEQARAGQRPEPEPLPVQYGDYAEWQATHLSAAALERESAYWQQRLADCPRTLDLPTDHRRPDRQSHQGAIERFELDEELCELARAVSREQGCTLFMAVLAAWSVVLSRWSGQEVLPLGTPVAGRARPEIEPLVGFFVNTAVLPVDLSGDPTFEELLRRARELTIDTFAHADLPFEQLVELLQPPRDLSRSPLFQHMLIMQDAPVREIATADLSIEVEDVHSATAKYDLTLLVEDRGDQLGGWLEYATDLFDEGTARRLIDHLRGVLRSGLGDPSRRVSQLEMLGAAETRRILEAGQGPSGELPAETVVELIDRRCRAHPEQAAVVFGDETVAYGTLRERADRLAGRLRRLGVGPGTTVALMVPRSADLVVALLGILKAGGAYLPLDLDWPDERLGFVLEDSGARVLVAGSPRYQDIPAAAGLSVLDLDDPHAADGETAAEAEPTDSEAPAAADDLAYVIYTSGSTGRPKGVMVEHRNLVNFCAGMSELLGEEGRGTWLAGTTVAFDISALELLWTLTTGSTVVIRPEKPSVRASAFAGAPASALDLSLFYFASATQEADRGRRGAYDLLLRGAEFADEHGFEAVWTPERHFHAFGGLYPNPSVAGAAIAARTSRVGIRAGSVVLPLHDPIRVAEEWAVVDNLSGGRAGISFASGWQADDFVLASDAYADRKERMAEGVRTVQRLWRGEEVERVNGLGETTRVRILPPPVSPELPTWITAAGSVRTFEVAGELGANVLTHLLGQSQEDLAAKIRAYRQAREEAGHGDGGRVSLMLHTFVGRSSEEAVDAVREPFTQYLATSFDLIRNLAQGMGLGADVDALRPEDLEALLAHAFDRFYSAAGLMGSVEECLETLAAIEQIGVDEVACLIDFGVEDQTVLDALPELDRVRRGQGHGPRPPRGDAGRPDGASVVELIRRHDITHFQCTPTEAAMILMEPGGPEAIGSLRMLLVGGEELPTQLAARLAAFDGLEVVNMYGPTETTIWSTSARVDGPDVTIGWPILNTTVRLLDAHGQLVPAGVVGELCIGGSGVTRGYVGRPELTAERFVSWDAGPGEAETLYRTGDLARLRADGTFDFLGRADFQVKVRGHRIELGEVEAALAAHHAVAQAVCTVAGDGAERRLVGFVVPEPGMQARPADIRAQAAERLPDYMVPATVVPLDELPRTSNGKVDRGALATGDLVGRSGSETWVPPRSVTEMRLAGLWEEVLDVSPVGATDDFFELGGHSVLAVSLFGRIERVFGRRLELASLFRAPTLEAMADLLDADGDADRQVLVDLRPGEGVPVFLLPGAGGNLVYLHELARRLPEGVPVLGLQPDYTQDALARADRIVEDMAAQYMDAVLEACPDGPYRLVGHSFGGYVALELGRLLRARGKHVELIGILDTAAPLPGRADDSAPADDPQWVATLAETIERLYGQPLDLSAEELRPLDQEGRRALLRSRMERHALLPPEIDDEQFRGFVETFIADQRCAYVPEEPYPGTITLLVAEELHPTSEPVEALRWTLSDPSRGWDRFATDGVDAHTVPGDHLTLLRPPNVDRVGELLGDLLEPAGASAAR